MGYFFLFPFFFFVLLHECLCQTIRPFRCQSSKLVNKVERQNEG
jgi:hypothetical protein